MLSLSPLSGLCSSLAWVCGTQGTEKDDQSLPMGLVLSKENGSWGWEVISRVVRGGLLGRGFVLHVGKLPREPGAASLPSCPPPLRPGMGQWDSVGRASHSRIQDTLKTMGEQSQELAGSGAQWLRWVLSRRPG